MKKKKEVLLNNKKGYEGEEYKKLFVIIIIISISFACLYLITSHFTKKDKVDIFKNDLDPSEIQYNEIIIGEMFNYSGEYYVLLSNKKEEYKSIYESLITTARNKNKKIYTVDLDQAFNKKYISEENNYSRDDFKISRTTLIRINDGEVKDHYVEKDEIVNKLKDLSKD